MSQQARLDIIEQWLQREDDELLYVPDCRDGSAPQANHYDVDEALTRLTLQYLNPAPQVFGVIEEVRNDGTVLVRVGPHTNIAG